jgi:TatD family-associated radical SAM protein
MMTIVYPVKSGLYLNMTNRCPCDCTFCLRQNGDGVYGSDPLWLDREPTVKEVCDSIDKWELSEYEELVFCGYGEPTCRFADLIAICRALREITNTPIRLNTNGQLLLAEGESAVLEMKGCFDTVSISLNEATPALYDAICHSEYGEDAFASILDFASRVKAVVPRVAFSVVDKFLSPASLAECRRIAAALDIPLRVRAYIGGSAE